ncbi:MAG: YceI family protein [Gammaproteobacteria bacterium]|nr:YceI family protein [Gammaproteobacteria bacterium]
MSGVKLSLAFIAGSLVAGISNAADLSAVPSGSYNVDPTHAYIHIQYNHLGLSNPILAFDEFSVDMDLDVEDPSKSTVAVDIVTDSVITGSDIFHDHITGAKWFDTAANPNITFSSSGVTANADGTFVMMGDLTIKGMTKPVSLDVVINNAMEHPFNKKPVVGISATGSVNRSEWGLGANAPYISDEVKIEIQAEMFKAE